MGPAEAANLALRLDPKVVIPCYYDLFRANLQPPQMLLTNLKILGIGENYRLVEHGRPFTFSESA
jgi:L-ascorbate 6-phosphate lactonase